MTPKSIAEQKPYSLLLVDDHQFVRMALRLLVSERFPASSIDEACSLEEGLRAASGRHHDLVLLDLDLPDSSGLNSLYSFMSAHPDAQVALISGDNAMVTIEAAMQKNIRGYIVKSQAPEVIAAAVGLMLAGERYIPASLYTSLASREAVSQGRNAELDSGTGMASMEELDQLRQQLTPRLSEVLELIVKGKSNKEISTHLGLSLGTVKNYVSIIFERLSLPNRSRTISHVMRLLAQPESKSK